MRYTTVLPFNGARFWLMIFLYGIILARGTAARGEEIAEVHKTPGPRFLVMMAERAADYYQFRQDLSLTDEQMGSIRTILRNVRRGLIQQDALLVIEIGELDRLFHTPLLNEKGLLAKLAVVERLKKGETEGWVQGFEQLQSVLNKEQISTYAFLKGVPMPVMEFPRGEFERIARRAIKDHGELLLQQHEELGLSDEQVRRLDSLNQGYTREMAKQAAFIESSHLEVQDLLSEPVINFDTLRKQVLENEKLESTFFSTMVARLMEAQAVLTVEQVKRLALLRDPTGATGK